MCGLAGVVSLGPSGISNLRRRTEVMGDRIAHRGPDGSGDWFAPDQRYGVAHKRLAIIDVTDSGAQPMVGEVGDVLALNGEIYNYRELRNDAVLRGRKFSSTSDAESVLAEYEFRGLDFLNHLRGMFAIALWDRHRERLILARDRFGIKPLYYCVVDDQLYFASEAKALVPFLPRVETDKEALAEYLTFQYLISDRTLFAGIRQVPAGHFMTVDRGGFQIEKYWDIKYETDFEHSEKYFVMKLRELMEESVELHMRSDVEVGAYVSGGVDSSLIAAMGSASSGRPLKGFNGRFDQPDYDESRYAQAAVDSFGGELFVRDLTVADFERDLRKVIWHLDHPVAGPGSFPQYETSETASQHVKVVLGGQGGDEIFGGYARYLVAYLEQCLRGAIEGTANSGHFVVTMESMIPNLGVLREYQPLMQRFWKHGLFGELDERYFRLIDRSAEMGAEVRLDALNMESVQKEYLALFNSEENVGSGSYFDRMTHFEFRTLLPGLLQVEDRMSMAHGLESRVPLLDHPLIELAATVPADIKFKDGQLKRLLKETFADRIPKEIFNRRDKMGFPVPLTEWLSGPLFNMAEGILESLRDRDMPEIDGGVALTTHLETARFSRSMWALINLELWQQLFHDQQDSDDEFRP